MRLLGFAIVPLLFVPPAFAQAPGVPAGSTRYTLVEADNGKAVGSAEASVTTVPGGYQITSRGDLKMAKFSYSFSNTNRLDSQLNIVNDQLTGTVNGAQVTFNLASDPAGRQFQVSIEASGKTTTNTVDRHQNLALLPDLDPAAYIEMAHFALENPPTPWIIVPKQNGLLVPAQYNAQPDVSGTLQGHSTVVHHTTVTVSEENGITVELYYSGDGRLVEADLPEQNFYVVADGFRLQNRPHYTPPRGAAPPPDNQQPDVNQPPQPQNP
jgi:YD repeat-containing protein